MWDDTHKPAAWQDFVGNPSSVQQCKDWLRGFQEGKPVPRVLIISGPEGCGKSLAAELLLKKQGYKSYAFGVKDIKNHKRDKNSLDNFCNLYTSDISTMGAKRARRSAHGIILEDYEGLTKSDKTFNKVIIDLIKRHPHNQVPLIVTTTEICTGKQTSSSGSTGLLRLAYIVPFQRLTSKDLIKLAMRVAAAENVALNQQPAEVFAANAQGDARSLLLAMQMFYVGRKDMDLNDITRDELAKEITDFADQNAELDTPLKIFHGVEGGISAAQSEDERILGMAIGDRNNRRTAREQHAALQLVKDNSMQFMPFLFQAYPACLPKPAGNMSGSKSVEIALSSIQTAAAIAEEMSMGDVARVQTWGDESHYEVFPAIGLELPIKRIRLANQDSSSNFTVSVEGYQTYYGMENTYSHQQGIMQSLREMNPFIGHDMDDLNYRKELFGALLTNKNITDKQLVESLWPTHPNFLETLGKLKIKTCTYSLSKARLKRLVKCYEELEEEHAVRVKYLDDPADESIPEHFKQKRKPDEKQKQEAANDVFSIGWD